MYQKNRCPTKAVRGKTPYEAWHGEKPKVNHLRVFGCDAFAHIPKDERGKLDTKARKCILLGYGEETKGYGVYDVTKKKTLHSRDVKFNEGSKNCTQGSLDVKVDDYTLIVDMSSETDPDTESETEDEQPNNENGDEPSRRSTRQRRPPDFYGSEQSHLTTETPTTFMDANASQDRAKWKAAMETEMKSLEENEVLEPCEATTWKEASRQQMGV